MTEYQLLIEAIEKDILESTGVPHSFQGVYMVSFDLFGPGWGADEIVGSDSFYDLPKIAERK